MSTLAEAADTVVTFFEGLDAMSPLLRLLLGDGPLSVGLDIRAEAVRRIVIDATADRVCVRRGEGAAPTAVRVAADARVWGDVLSGRVAPGAAHGRRQLLLRGSAADLARLIALLEMAPPLFRDHESRRAHTSAEAHLMTTNPRSVRSLLAGPRAALDRLASSGLHRAAFWTGYSIGRLRRSGLDRTALMDLLASAARGWERAEQAPRQSERGDSVS